MISIKKPFGSVLAKIAIMIIEFSKFDDRLRVYQSINLTFQNLTFYLGWFLGGRSLPLRLELYHRKQDWPEHWDVYYFTRTIGRYHFERM